MLTVAMAIVAIGRLWRKPRAELRPYLRAFAFAAVMVVVIVGPFIARYLSLQQDPNFRRAFDPTAAAHATDYLAASPSNPLLRHVPIIGHYSIPQRSTENRLFPGTVASLFGIVGVIAVWRDHRQQGWRHRRRRELVLIGTAGAALAVLAFGDWTTIAHHRIWLPFAVVRYVVPGFTNIREVARLALGAELALVLFAAVGLEIVMRHIGKQRGPYLATAAALFVLVESVTPIRLVHVPTSRDDGGIDTALRRLPRGVVLELPIQSNAHPLPWAYIETPRQLLALGDGHPRVNGYSGFQPADFYRTTTLLNQIPNPGAVAAARHLGVRYLVLRTRLPGTVSPTTMTPELTTNGVGQYTNQTAQHILAALPPTDITHIQTLPGGYLIQLK